MTRWYKHGKHTTKYTDYIKQEAKMYHSTIFCDAYYVRCERLSNYISNSSGPTSFGCSSLEL
jgi:hypothetical protein